MSSSSLCPMHICQKWREIMLGVPLLWTVIHKEDNKCAMLCFMHRLWNLPLNGSCPIFMCELDGFTALIAPHTLHICSLHTYIYSNRVFDFYTLLAAHNFDFSAL